MAGADDRPRHDRETLWVRSPKAGFWYRAIRHPGEEPPGPDRFAACAFPLSLDVGRYGTYVIDEGHVVRRNLLGHAKGVDVLPSTPEGWEVISGP